MSLLNQFSNLLVKVCLVKCITNWKPYASKARNLPEWPGLIPGSEM